MKRLWLWIAVGMLAMNLAALADDAPTGTVQGKDRYNSGCFVVQMPSELKLARRDFVRIMHDGTLVTEARIVQIREDQVSVQPLDPKAVVQTGDVVIYEGATSPTAPAVPTAPAGGAYKPQPKVLQSGLHLSINPAATFTDENGYWAANCLIMNEGDETAWIHIGATFTASDGQAENIIDKWLDLAPGENQTVLFTSRFKSPFGQRNEVNEHQGVTGSSNWTVANGQVNGFTSVMCEVHPKYGSKGKPKTRT